MTSAATARTAAAPASRERFLRRPEVEAMTSLGRSQIYALAKQGKFPAPLALSPRHSVWLSSEVEAWIASRIPANRKGFTP